MWPKKWHFCYINAVQGGEVNRVCARTIPVHVYLFGYIRYASQVGRHLVGRKSRQCGKCRENPVSVVNPANSQCVTISKCFKDIKGHLRTFMTGSADSTITTEAEPFFWPVCFTYYSVINILCPHLYGL